MSYPTAGPVTRRRSSLFRLNNTITDCDVKFRDQLKEKVDEFRNYSEAKRPVTNQENHSLVTHTLPEEAEQFLKSLSEVVDCYSKASDDFVKRHCICECQMKQISSKLFYN